MYESFESRGQSWKDTIIALETATLARADRTAVATEATRRSAIDDHGADPNRVSVVPLGANILPDEREEVVIPATAPTRDDLRILLTAVVLPAGLDDRLECATRRLLVEERDSIRESGSATE